MKKIILDTDIGGDIDDSLALSYLLKQPECDLLGHYHRVRRRGNAGQNGERAVYPCRKRRRSHLSRPSKKHYP